MTTVVMKMRDRRRAAGEALRQMAGPKPEPVLVDAALRDHDSVRPVASVKQQFPDITEIVMPSSQTA